MQVGPPPSSDWGVFLHHCWSFWFDWEGVCPQVQDANAHTSTSEASAVKISASTNVRRQEVHVHAPFKRQLKWGYSKMLDGLMRFGRFGCLPAPTRLIPATAWHAQRRKHGRFLQQMFHLFLHRFHLVSVNNEFIKNVEPVRSNPLLLSDFAFVLSSFLIFFICSLYCHPPPPRTHTYFSSYIQYWKFFLFWSHQLYVSKKLIIYIKKANKISTDK